jgi:hypothetical protein
LIGTVESRIVADDRRNDQPVPAIPDRE